MPRDSRRWVEAVLALTLLAWGCAGPPSSDPGGVAGGSGASGVAEASTKSTTKSATGPVEHVQPDPPPAISDATYRRRVSAAGSAGAAALLAQGGVLAAYTHEASGHFHQSLQLIRSAPSEPAVQVLAVRLALRQGDWRAAREMLTRDGFDPLPEDRTEVEWLRTILHCAEGDPKAEGRLRSALRDPARAEDAALALALVLGSPMREQVPDALAIVTAAQDVVGPQPALECLRAALERDMGLRWDARQRLRLLASADPTALDPAAWFDLAELEVLVEDVDAARVALHELRQRWGTHPWLARHSIAVQDLEGEVRSGGPFGLSSRDILALLRASDSDDLLRMGALDTLRQLGGVDCVRGVLIGMRDAVPEVRAMAVEALPVNAAGRAALVRTALEDKDQRVRCAGVRSSSPLPPQEAKQLLKARLAVEQDPVVLDLLRTTLERLR